MIKKKFTILSIEDNQPDFFILKQALSKINGISLDIININDGKDAIDFLFNENNKKPELIILDINLPTISGKEILSRIKTDTKLKIIPVIIFSTCDNEKDIEECYSLYANSYITKCFSIDGLFKKIADMGAFWLQSSEMPSTASFYLDKGDF